MICYLYIVTKHQHIEILTLSVMIKAKWNNFDKIKIKHLGLKKNMDQQFRKNLIDSLAIILNGFDYCGIYH